MALVLNKKMLSDRIKDGFLAELKGHWIMKIIDTLFGTHSEREIKKIDYLADSIMELRPLMMKLSDEECLNKYCILLNKGDVS